MKKLSTLLVTTVLSLSLHAKSNTETLGDVLAVAIPLTGYGATLYNHDKQGQKEFYYAYGTDILLTNVLKYTIFLVPQLQLWNAHWSISNKIKPI
ncbi:MAG TPA: hypothetical protein ENK94_03645 [Campylobacterales bacterium]|nr:hypothetical protein [Campylobacterales bacterium]